MRVLPKAPKSKDLKPAVGVWCAGLVPWTEVLLAELEDAVCTSSVMGELESPDDAEVPEVKGSLLSALAEVKQYQVCVDPI